MMPGVGILSTPTIAKADGVFTIRATSTIDATAQEVYERLLDVDRYAAWNTFTPHVQRTSCVSPEQLNVQDQITLEANIGCECLIHIVICLKSTKLCRFASANTKITDHRYRQL